MTVGIVMSDMSRIMPITFIENTIVRAMIIAII
jgi:hypothetical protein